MGSIFDKHPKTQAVTNVQVYTIAMAVNTQVQAMAMQAENMQRAALGQSMAYDEADFLQLLKDNRMYADAIVKDLKR